MSNQARTSMWTIAEMLRQIVKDGAPIEQVRATGKALAESAGYEWWQGEMVASINGFSSRIFIDTTDSGTPTIEYWN